MNELTLVTGANGFVGQALVQHLLDQGHSVRALVLPGEAPPAGWEGRVEVVRGNICLADDVRRCMAGVAVVQHLAAAVGDWIPWSIHEAVTIDGTRHVIDAVSEQGGRLVLTSSVTVYGHFIGQRACDESVPHGRPMGYYSRAKQAQERLLGEAHRIRGLDSVIVRPGNIYGPDCGPWLRELGEALKRGTPSLIAPEHANAGLVHVRSIASLLLAAQQRAESGTIFNGCDELEVTWHRYFDDIARLVRAPPPRRLPYWLGAALAPVFETAWRLLRRSERPPITREALNLVAHDNQFPTDKARSVLGWRPAVSYADALAEIEAVLIG